MSARSDGRADRFDENRTGVRTLAALLHIRELIAEARNAALGELGGAGLHEGVVHAGSSPMGEYEQTLRGRRTNQHARHPARLGANQESE